MKKESVAYFDNSIEHKYIVLEQMNCCLLLQQVMRSATTVFSRVKWTELKWSEMKWSAVNVYTIIFLNYVLRWKACIVINLV
jgi:hypothetical protein